MKHCVDHPAASDFQTCRGVFYGSDCFLCGSPKTDTLVLQMLLPNAGSAPVFYCEVTDTCTRVLSTSICATSYTTIKQHYRTVQVAIRAPMCLCTSVNGLVYINEVPLVQVAGNDHECE